MDPDTDVYQTEQPQISYSFDFTAEQSRAIQSPNLLGREGTYRSMCRVPSTSTRIACGVPRLYITWLAYPIPFNSCTAASLGPSRLDAFTLRCSLSLSLFSSSFVPLASSISSAIGVYPRRRRLFGALVGERNDLCGTSLIAKHLILQYKYTD